MKYYYELQWPVSACWTPKNCEHMTEKELIKDATARINDYLIEEAREENDIKRIELYQAYDNVINSNTDFDRIKFPIMQKVYSDDDQALNRFASKAELDPEQNMDF